jgi:hypothetical protein
MGLFCFCSQKRERTDDDMVQCWGGHAAEEYDTVLHFKGAKARDDCDEKKQVAVLCCCCMLFVLPVLLLCFADFVCVFLLVFSDVRACVVVLAVCVSFCAGIRNQSAGQDNQEDGAWCDY